MLRRHEIAEAARASLHAEAVHSALAPLLCGESGLPAYRGFLERMNAVMKNQEPGEGGQEGAEAFDKIAARAPTQPVAAIVNDPETQRRLAAIQRGERP